jgi:murein DD-endopeptidase MepM/ murein hydrolase activator NlpD
MAKPTNTPLRSPLVSAFNNIVNINRSKSTMRSTQNSYNEFLRFMNVEVKNIKAIKLPSEKQVKKLSNLNVASTFGSAGSLLSSLASGALDAAGLVGNFFGGGNRSNKAGKAIPKGKGIRLGGIKAIGVANALFAGLDFATGLAQGESAGKAAAGAGGALAGSLLGGAIGQALIPVPGLGFVIGSMAGNFLGGYLGDRGYETATGGDKVKEKVKARLKEQEKKQKLEAAATQVTLPQVLDKFDNVITEFKKTVANLDLGSESGSSDMEEGFGEDSGEGGEPTPPDTPTEPYDGPVSKDTFFPLPKGIVSNSSVGVSGGEYGAPRSYGGHSGQDIGGLPPGSPVVAWKTGKVRYSGSVESGDTILTIDHGGGEQSVYKHVVPTVAPGTVVYGGQQIAKLFASRAYPEHLHFEVWKNGSHINPNGYISASQKIPAPLTVQKAKEQSEKSSGKSSVASGANPPAVPTATAKSQTPAVGDAKPNSSGQDLSRMSTTQLRGMLDPTVTGNTNPAVFKAAQEARTTGQESGLTGDALERAVMIASIKAKNAESQVIAMTQQPALPQQLEQYPSYNTAQNSVTFIPMMMGGPSGGSQQRPMVVSSGGGGGTTIMPPVPQGQVLNSLFNTMLLTNLSGT